MKNVTIYTDGACSGNPGKGGWGCVLIYKDSKKEFSGYEETTTNNRMELTAIIEALKKLKEPCCVDLYTDSAYVSNAFLQDWISTWKLNGYKNSNKKEILNKDLWLDLINLCDIHKVNFHKVKGHSTNELNNRCDKLATDEVKKHS